VLRFAVGAEQLEPMHFMVEAIGQAAEAARKTMLKSGKGYDADDVQVYIRKRISGKKATRPNLKFWRD